MDECDYRIIVPAKGCSERAPEKNSMLLSWTLDYVCRLNLEDKAVVLSQHKGYLREGERRGIRSVVEKQKYADQIPALNQAVEEMGWQDKYIVLLQPTQPLRQYWLLDRCLTKLRGNSKDLVTTCSLREEKLHKFVELEEGGYQTEILYQPLLTCAVLAVHASTLTKFESHLAMWKESKVHLVPHKYPGNMDFDYPEDMISVPLLTRSVFDLFFYSEV